VYPATYRPERIPADKERTLRHEQDTDSGAGYRTIGTHGLLEFSMKSDLMKHTEHSVYDC
jgi:hypothetical protein